MISFYIFAFFFTLIVTYALVPVNIKWSKKNELIDVPHSRGVHSTPTPIAGGISFVFPVLLVQLVGFFIFPQFDYELLYLFAGSTFIAILGIIDDKTQLKAKYKLIIQMFIVTFLFIGGLKIQLLTNPFGEDILLGFLSFPITILWFLLIMNAFNLIDGLDGLAAGIALIVSGVLFTVGFIKHNEVIQYYSLAIMGGNLAFLKYNFYPAKIFMGDTGSLFLGFNIAVISIVGKSEFKGITTMTLLIPVIALSIPIIDTFLAVFRRVKMKKNIFKADKDHLHHKLLNWGLSQKSIALISYFITLLFGLIAIGFSYSSKKLLLGLLLSLLLILLVIVYNVFKKELKK